MGLVEVGVSGLSATAAGQDDGDLGKGAPDGIGPENAVKPPDSV